MCSKNHLFLLTSLWVGSMIAVPELKQSFKKTCGATYRYAAYYPRAVASSHPIDVEFWSRVKTEYTVEPIMFGGTYFMLDLGAKKICENDSVKQCTQNIPSVVGENLKFAFAAGAARTINTLMLDGKKGMNSQSGKDFGKGLAFQVGGEIVKECVLEPIVDEFMGSEESLEKEVFNAIGVLVMTGLIFSNKY